MADLIALFEEVLGEFLSQESANILNQVNERNLCARLAMYLELAAKKHGLKGYYADTEYNRQQDGQIKTILDDEMDVITINCDVILHSRGEIVERDNLIAIEMKKSNRPEKDKMSDRSRLRALTKASYDGVWSADGVTHPEHVCGYELGFFLELDIRKSAVQIEVYEQGALTRTFRNCF